MITRTFSPLFAALLTLVTACRVDSVPTAPPTETARFALQVINYLPRTAHLDAFVAPGPDGPWRRVAEGINVNPPRQPVDLALGGDPEAMRDVPLKLAEGTWFVRVTETESGEAGTVQLRSGGHNWMIAFLGSDGVMALTDTGPRRLE